MTGNNNLEDPVKLTAPQLAALRYYGTSLDERGDRVPRRDLIGRLVSLGLVTVRTDWVHVGSTYRSRQVLTVVDVHLTDEGRALLAG